MKLDFVVNRKGVSTVHDDLMMMLMSPHTPNSYRELIHYFWGNSIFDPSTALSIDKIAEALGKHRTSVSKDLAGLAGFRIFDCKKEGKFKRYFLRRAMINKMSESEFVNRSFVNNSNDDKKDDVVPEETVKSVVKEKSNAKYSQEVKEVYDYYMDKFERDPRYKLDTNRKGVIKARLEDGYSVEELKLGIDYVRASEFHMGQNEQGKLYIDLNDHVFNKKKFERNLEEIKRNNFGEKVQQKAEQKSKASKIIEERKRQFEEMMNGD